MTSLNPLNPLKAPPSAPGGTPGSPRARRGLGHVSRAVAVGTVAALTLSACGGGDDDDQVELRFTWWGGAERAAYTQEIIDAFEEENPGITISAEFDSWEGYWDSLATQTAAQDTPDIIQMDAVYIREYIDNGILLELDQVDTSALPDELVADGELDDQLYGMPIGSTTPTIMTNPDVFEEAGVDLPDDETWTWDDLAEVGGQISESTDARGQARPFGDAGMSLWLRQNVGVDMTDEEGQIAFEPEDVVPYFERIQQLEEDGVISSGDQVNEDRAQALEQTMIATGGAAMDGIWWDTQSIALSSNDGVDLTPVMPPSETGSAEDAQLWYKASMFYSAYAGTDHPEEAQMFIDYLVNNEEAGQLQQLERGIPSNEDIREAIRDDLDEAEAELLDYSEGLEDVVAEGPPLPPQGFGTVQEIVFRYEEQVLFGDSSPEEAAQQMHSEIESALQ